MSRALGIALGVPGLGRSGGVRYTTLPRYLLTNSGTLLEDFDTAAEWTVSAGSAAINNTAGEFRVSTGSMKMTSQVGGPCTMTKTIANTVFAGGCYARINFYLYAADAANISVMRVYLATSGAFTKYYVEDILVANVPFKVGWNTLDIYPDMWGSNGGATWADTFTTLRIRLDPLTGTQLNMSIDSMYTGLESVPAAMITFDDAAASIYDNAYSHMKTKRARGTFYVITGTVNTATYVTSAQLIEMDGSDWSISNHTRAHTNLTTVSQADAQTAIANGKTDLDGWGLTEASAQMSIPFGAFNTTVLAAIAAENVGAARCSNVYSYPALDANGDNKYLLPMSAPVSQTLATYKTTVDNAVLYKRPIVLLFHSVIGGGEITPADFIELINYIVSKNMPFITAKDVYDCLAGPITVPIA